MRVSAIVPTYEQPDLLVPTLRAILDQTRPPDEVIVIDDGSGPATRAALEPLMDSIRYHRQENGGPGSAKNAGIEKANGDLIAFCDHDDLWLPGKIEAHVARHEADPELALTYSRVTKVREDGVVKREHPRRGPEGRVFGALLDKSFVPTCSAVVVRRDALQAVGPFDETFRLSDDYDLWFRLARRHTFGFIPESLVRYRVHAASASRAYRLLHEEKVRIFRGILEGPEPLSRSDRRRARRRLARHLVGVAKNLLREGEGGEARRLFREVARLAPWRLRYQRYRLQSFLRGG